MHIYVVIISDNYLEELLDNLSVILRGPTVSGFCRVKIYTKLDITDFSVRATEL